MTVIQLAYDRLKTDQEVLSICDINPSAMNKCMGKIQTFAIQSNSFFRYSITNELAFNICFSAES